MYHTHQHHGFNIHLPNILVVSHPIWGATKGEKKKTLRNTGKNGWLLCFKPIILSLALRSKSGYYKCICPALPFFGGSPSFLVLPGFFLKEMCLDVFNFIAAKNHKVPMILLNFVLPFFCQVVASKIPFKLHLPLAHLYFRELMFSKKTTPWHSDRRHRPTSSARRYARTWPSGFPKDSERSGRSPRRRPHPHCKVDPQTCPEKKKTGRKLTIS